MEDSIASVVGLILYILCIYYCWRIAKKLGKNQVVAVIVGIILPIGGALIYNHLSYRDKKGTAPKQGIFK